MSEASELIGAHPGAPYSADDGIRCLTCSHRLWRYGAAWVHQDPGPVRHQPTAGPTELHMEHESGSCVWCDAARWREAVAEGLSLIGPA